MEKFWLCKVKAGSMGILGSQRATRGWIFIVFSCLISILAFGIIKSNFLRTSFYFEKYEKGEI
jgi:hypothetical protein